MDVEKKHRSHIGAKRAKGQGWRKIPSRSVREKTRRLGQEVKSENSSNQ